MARESNGRPQQRLRTRKDLLQAAARLLKRNRRPSLEEIAAEAMVSRATAYRYFPHVGALLAEAAVDVDVPDPAEFLKRAGSEDPIERLEQVDQALQQLFVEHEAQMRLMLAHAVTRAIEEDADATPARQNRRSPLIAAALAPARGEFTAAALRRLEQALALVIGTDGMIVARDVLGIEDAEIRRVKRWVIRSLVEAARRN